jgi:hypothetical protein
MEAVPAMPMDFVGTEFNTAAMVLIRIPLIHL